MLKFGANLPRLSTCPDIIEGTLFPNFDIAVHYLYINKSKKPGEIKKDYICGKCNSIGHNARTCKN